MELAGIIFLIVIVLALVCIAIAARRMTRGYEVTPYDEESPEIIEPRSWRN